MPLPNFIIGGVRRGGSTSLYHAIRQHPDIFVYPHSELNYFTEEGLNGREWRSGRVDPDHWEATHSVDEYAALFSEGDRAAAIGHKGADLLYWQPAHARMARFVPQAKFIFTLRNPMRRAWSHYWVECTKGREALGFEEAINKEENRARRSDWARFHLSYIARGFYDISLKQFLGFFPREQVFVITLEETIAQPRKVLKSVYRFLGVDPTLGLELAGTKKKQNWATTRRTWTNYKGLNSLSIGYEKATSIFAKWLTRSGESRRRVRKAMQIPIRRPVGQSLMTAEYRARLEALYAPHIVALENLLGQSFAIWKNDQS